MMKYWDIGEASVVRPSVKALGSILNALIICHGKLHDTHSLELGTQGWRYPTRSCAVVLRVSIPEGLEPQFEGLAGVKLSEIPQVKVCS